MNPAIETTALLPVDGAQAQVRLLQAPIDIRSLSLVVLATLASIFMLRWASAVFIPLMVGLLFSYGLSPVVDWLAHRRVPRALSAAVLVLGIVMGIASAAYSLSDDVSRLIEAMPLAVQKLRKSIGHENGKPDQALAAMQRAASQLELAVEEASRAKPIDRNVQRVHIAAPKFDVRSYLWTSTMGMLGMLGQVGIVALITFFLMASGNTFRRKLVKISGATLSSKKITLQALNEIHDQIQRYMLVQIFASTLMGITIWLSFLWVGLDNAAVWGIAAGVLNLVPYLGNLLITAGAALFGFMQFGSVDMALLIAGITLVVNSLESYLLTPWLTSRAGKMNPVAVFVGVLAWGWLWGAWGMLLGVPILMVIKAICDRIEDFKAVGEFLGD